MKKFSKHGSTSFTPVKPIDLGIEYVNGKRETFAGDDYKDNRVGLMAKYSF